MLLELEVEVKGALQDFNRVSPMAARQTFLPCLRCRVFALKKGLANNQSRD